MTCSSKRVEKDGYAVEQSISRTVGDRGIPFDKQAIAAPGIVLLGSSNKGPIGTGFFADESLITADHVLRELLHEAADHGFETLTMKTFSFAMVDRTLTTRTTTFPLIDPLNLITKSFRFGGTVDVAAIPISAEVMHSLMEKGITSLRLTSYYPCPANEPPNQPRVYIGGHPSGSELTFSSGKICDVMDFRIKHDVGTSPGSSGSPVFMYFEDDDDWEVIAVHHTGFVGDEGKNQATLMWKVMEEIQNRKATANFNRATKLSPPQLTTIDSTDRGIAIIAKREDDPPTGQTGGAPAFGGARQNPHSNFASESIRVYHRQ